MTDRELLDLAAKAAGIDLSAASWGGGRDGFYWVDGLSVRYWDPLTDDGDALRLAVKLGLDVCIDTRQEDGACTHSIGFRDSDTAETFDAIEAHGAHGDPYAATRRAIVRAAAEIGSAKP